MKLRVLKTSWSQLTYKQVADLLADLLVVPEVPKSRTAGRGFIYQDPHLWNHPQVGIRFGLGIVLKLSSKSSFVINLIGRAVSGDPKPCLSYAARDYGCWKLRMIH